MSLTAARLARGAASRRILATPSRPYSSHSEDHHDDHHHHKDSTVYPEDKGFVNAFWAKVVGATAVVYVGIKLAPSPGKDTYLTRWIDMYSQDAAKQLDFNIGHTLLTRQAADDRLTFLHARRPLIHRMQTPHAMDNGSPFCSRVGLNADMSNVQVKS